VLSLSFSEYLLFKDSKMGKLHCSFEIDTQSSALTAPVEQTYMEYLLYGGLPRAALTHHIEEKVEILDDIYKTYLLKDVRSYVKNEHIIGFNKMLRILASQIGSLVNINEISRESSLPYRSCETYLDLLEQMYIIKLIEPYFTNRRKVINKMKKIYFCDLGLRNMIDGNFNAMEYRSDSGAIFENGAMLELWRRKGAGGALQFYRTFDGTEVDFVLTRLSGKTAVECKFKTLEKPVHLIGFHNFCETEGVGQRFVVNRNLNVQHNGVQFIQGFLANRI
jgi:predicted AAA+ superfamily ATPase